MAPFRVLRRGATRSTHTIRSPPHGGDGSGGLSSSRLTDRVMIGRGGSAAAARILSGASIEIDAQAAYAGFRNCAQMALCESAMTTAPRAGRA